MGALDNILKGEEGRHSTLVLSIGFAVLIVGLVSFNQLVGFVNFTFAVSNNDLLLVTSIASIIGGLFIIFNRPKGYSS